MIERRAVLNAVRDAIFLADAETGMIVDANPAAEALCGRSPAELLSLHHTQLHPPEAAEWARHTFHQQTRVPGLTEGFVMHKDGHRIPVEVSSSHFTTSDGRLELVGVFRDTTERNEAREALRRSEERFRRVAESAGEFIWEVDRDGLYTYANPVVEEILGHTPEELVGRMHFYDFFVPDTREEIKAAAFGAFGRGEPFRAFLNWNVRKDGRKVALETNGVPILDTNGRLLGYRGADTDVTERKQAEEALRTSEDKYRALVETTGTGYLIIDKEGKVLDANREYVRLTGHRELGEILGRSVIEWTAAHEKQKNAEAVARCAKHGFVRNFVVDYVDGNKRITPIEINATVIGSGESLRIVALCRDITERKRVEDAVRESERRFDELAEHSRTTAWEVDPQGLFTYVSHVSEASWGYRPDEVVGRMHFYDLHPETGREAFRTAVFEVTGRKLPFRDVVHTVGTKDGRIAWGSTSGIPMLNADGTLRGYRGTCTDITERKRAEERLVTIMKAVEATSDAVGISDAHGRHYYQNAALSNLFGYATAEELEAAGGGQAVVKDPLVARELFESIMRGNPWAGELEMVTKTGRVFPVYERADAIKDSEGNIIGLIGIITDITERKQAERALRESEERFRATFEQAMVGIAHVATDGRFLRVNQRFCQIVGYSQQQVLERTFQDITHPDDLEADVEQMKCLLRGEIETYSMEKRFIRDDGSQVWADLTVALMRNQAGNPGWFVSVIQDISERKETENALRRSEERFRQVAESAGEFIWEVDRDGLYTYANPVVEQILGYTPEEIIGRMHFYDLFVPGVRENLKKIAFEVFARRERFRAFPNWNVRKDGRVVLLETSGTPILDSNGNLLGYRGADTDVTERKRAEEAAFERQKLESVGTLASGIAHDFNNLLGGVLAHAELALAELAAGSRPEEELAAIRDASIRGSEIVRQLMVYAGKESEVVNSVDLSRIVEEMLRLLKFSVSKHATVVAHLGKDLPTVQANAGQLRQIVLNLVTNASQAIGERDGVIRVTTECVTAGRDGAWGISEDLAEGDYLKLEVSDTGCGMPQEMQARVFDPFFTTKSAGHGLGLAVVQGTVRSLRGTIRVESEPGNGTTFQILLPCTRTQLVAPHSSLSSAEELKLARPLQEATVLVVEDEDSLRAPVSKLMRNAGFSVLEASDGSAAMEAIRANKSQIDVLFLDITLPGIPSRTVFEEAKRLGPQMSLIVTSAHSKDVAEEKLGGKIECFLRKPYRLNDLMDLVRQRLSQSPGFLA